MMAWIFSTYTDQSGPYLPGAPFVLALALIAICAAVFAIAAQRMKHEALPPDQQSQEQVEVFD